MIEIVANYNLAASLDLKRIGVDPRKVVPFDWPGFVCSAGYRAKSSPLGDRPFRLNYVGKAAPKQKAWVTQFKSVNLRKRGKQVELTIIGRGESEKFKMLARTEMIERHVFFLGPKSNLAGSRGDAGSRCCRGPKPVGISRGGLPMTLYEALCRPSTHHY